MRKIGTLMVASLLAASLGPASQAADPAGAAALAEFRAAAQLTPDRLHGAELFGTCAACHGPQGRGTADGAIPAIAGQHGSVILKQLVDFRHDRRWDERMAHFTDRHHLPTAQDLTDVAAYASSLPRFPSTEGIGDGTALSEGASAYFRVCEACHGPLGQGDVLRLRPRLAGQHYAYLLRQLTETAAGQRPGMDPAHVERLRGFTPTQLRGIADYLSRMSPDLSSHPQRTTR
ncbi:MAG TPA: c-type cytochrome [Steroidobacteraceae bacterium]|nr:c-type cytochrome [Steroidobacteraceae bacterium]